MPRIRIDTCLGCGVTKTRENTYWSNKDNALRPRCKSCVSKYHKEKHLDNPTARDTNHLWYTFGLTQQGYEELLERQGGVCAICGGEEPLDSRFSVDHDHSCCPGRKSCGKCIRGLLCRQCNTGIGNLGESIETLQSAIEYLEKTMLKVVAVDCCGYIVRTTAKWLDEGLPQCPHGVEMEVEEK